MAPIEQDAAEEAPPPAADGDRRAEISRRAAFWTFVVLVAAAFPLILFHLAAYHWFLRDDFYFITQRSLSSPDDLFRPHDSHWSTVPVIAFRVLWKLFGFNSYKPYQACVIALHLAVAVLLRALMRQARVGPWIATAAAGAFLLFGPGDEDIVWAFQIGFTGALAFGLVQLYLSGHDGPFDRRDLLGIAAGIVALMCSGVGIVMAFVVGLAVLVRRGWRAAAACAGPLAVTYGIYWLIERPSASGPFGRPDIPTVLRWVRSGEIATFDAIGHWAGMAWLLVALLVLGLALVTMAGRGSGIRARLAAPLALLVGGVVFGILTAVGRWYLGEAGARASRFVYLDAAFALPALAVAADAIARRWRVLTPVLALVFVVAVPVNVAMFGTSPFNRAFFAREKRILTTVTRLPYAGRVPRDVRPYANPYLPPELDMEFLRNAARSGRLPVSKGPISKADLDEYRVRLGLDQKPVTSFPRQCVPYGSGTDIRPEVHDVIRFLTPMWVRLLDVDTKTTPVPYDPADGQQLTVVLPGMHLRITPIDPSRGVVLCAS